MASEVEICSRALNLLGEHSIFSFDDGTTAANLCRDFYPIVRDAVLRAYPWNCAIVRAQLARLTETPLFGFSYMFELPTDPYCLRVLDTEPSNIRWRVERRALLCDEPSIKIRYIARITDSGQFDSLLLQAIIFRLAATISKAITGTVDAGFWQLYRMILEEARSIDGLEGTVDAWESDTLIEVR